MAVIDEEVVATTNELDQQEVAVLRKRLEETNAATSETTSHNLSPPPDWEPVPTVSIDEGRWKYVLISATEPYSTDGSGECYTSFYVTSKKYAEYHRNAAEPYVNLLQSRGYRDIHVSGGGRIHLDSDERTIHIFGFSYGFGLGDHAAAKRVIERDERYKGFKVTWSNDGY
ncbi:hypothetical protein CTEN210_17338 [Chaetoceros tenuissimus]|uniref:14 kDa phosphohistidine phosphatase n=1 Tax=Chaetoceros tenuissimus TaxID=426638 RepID=A0AAD3DBC5_9STRA|nr:hypothetical protein CTEN210_17338 [Chaetoceros tenuissimus]